MSRRDQEFDSFSDILSPELTRLRRSLFLFSLTVLIGAYLRVPIDQISVLGLTPGHTDATRILLVALVIQVCLIGAFILYSARDKHIHHGKYGKDIDGAANYYYRESRAMRLTVRFARFVEFQLPLSLGTASTFLILSWFWSAWPNVAGVWT